MRWFGESWGAPICDPEQHAPTPVGETCMYCDHGIKQDEQGLLIPYYDGEVSEEKPWHIDCFMKSIGALDGMSDEAQDQA